MFFFKLDILFPIVEILVYGMHCLPYKNLKRLLYTLFEKKPQPIYISIINAYTKLETSIKTESLYEQEEKDSLTEGLRQSFTFS